MNREDLFINFLPDEYLPKPEWRSFPLVALVVLIAIGLGIFVDWQRLSNDKANAVSEAETATKLLDSKKVDAAAFIPVQAQARALNTYLKQYAVLKMANPPWHEEYNRIEEVLPDGVWISNFRFVGTKRGWPAVSMTVVVGGTRYGPLYELHKRLLTSHEYFSNVQTTGFQVAQVQGEWVLTSTFSFKLETTV